MSLSSEIEICTNLFKLTHNYGVKNKPNTVHHLDNHCCPYIRPSHCKNSHTLYIKNGSKSNTNSQLQTRIKANFHQKFKLFSEKKIYANNGGHFKIVSIIKKNIKFIHITL